MTYVYQFKYSAICGEDPIGECIHSAEIELQNLKEDQDLDKIKNAIETSLTALSADVSESKKDGTVYNLGTLKQEDLADDLQKLIEIELKEKLQLNYIIN